VEKRSRNSQKIKMKKTEINKKYLFDGVSGFEYINKSYNPDNFKKSLNYIDEIIIHCTANDNEKWNNPIFLIEYDTHSNHISKNGCPFATYHYYINKPGEIFHLIDLKYFCWHCKAHNRNSIAVCIHHGGIIPNVTEQQMNSLIFLIKYLFEIMKWEKSEPEYRNRIRFHRDYANKFCPGFLDYEEVIEKLLENS